MGVPKFFRYISERYPCVTERLNDHQIPEFDNLYLDVNGIIHGCSHPEDDDILFRISEETIFNNIFRYLELLFRMIQPQKLFFIAVDGVAPRAKINQQRCRRFRTAKDVQILEAKARANNVVLPKEKRFDPNCITPGTLFMSKLDEQLKYFITYKISTDKLWQKCKVIFSGSQVPGEGEHKIMDYIRYMKSQPDYDVHTRHCLYGLDADLIMLGLCTHEIHFTLLREEVIFGRKHKKVSLTPEETMFCLFHLTLLREYIDHEFSSLKEKLQFPYDLEKIIDDWVLMGFLVGNDFIPHLPNLHIAQCALTVLFQVYMDVLPTLDGYINEAGTLKLDRFEKFMDRLSRFDVIQFSEVCADLKYLESKTGRAHTTTMTTSEKQNHSKSESSEDTMSPKRVPDKEFDALLRSAAEMSLGRDDNDEGDDESDRESYTMEFVQHKKDYYINKLKYETIDEDFLREQAEGYVRAIQWNLHYYYNGCCSWSWYYPHHYAPYISDIKDFKDLKLEFELSEPFLPFEQLLAALPPYSKDLLPAAFQQLLTEEQSPIISYYPEEFETDLNGKKMDWEAVVLIPFIDEKLLLDAMAPHYHKLTPEERARNKHGPMCVFTYTDEDLGVYKAPQYFPDIVSRAKLQLINREEIIVPQEKLIKGLCPGAKSDVYYPGFSSLRYINHTASLEKAKVKVFQKPSLMDSMILHVTPPAETNFSAVCTKLLGKTVYVNWPHLKEALVVSVSNSHTRLDLIGLQNRSLPENVNKNEWNQSTKRLAETYKISMGVDIGETSLLMDVRMLTGKKYVFGNHGKLHIEKQWASVQNSYAYQTVVKDIVVHANNVQSYNSVSDVFVPGTVCFMLGHPYYGAVGRVREPALCKKSGRIKVSVVTKQEPLLDPLKQVQAEIETQYMPGNIAAQRLGISNALLSRITGMFHVKQASDDFQQNDVVHNIGLRLKLIKQNVEAPGYTKKSEEGQWYYSPKAIDLIRSYMLKCPDLFERLAQNPTLPVFLEENLFSKGGELMETVSWLKERLKGIECRVCGAESVDSSLVKLIEEKVDAYLKTHQSSGKVVEMQVQPYLLYVPSLFQRNLRPDPTTQTQMLDRICCVRENFTVPLGYKGTVIGMQKSENTADIMYDVLFDETFVGGLSISGSSEHRAYRLSSNDFINISHGERVGYGTTGKDGSMEFVRSWNSATNQEAQLRASASAFASYRNKNHSPAEPWASPRPRIAQKNPGGMSQNDRTPVVHPEFKCNTPNVVQAREPYRTVKSLEVNAQRKPFAAEPTSEFQAIWNELHKKQESNKVVQQQPPMIPKGKQINNALPENTPQDPSAFLKAVLKIPAGDTQQVAQSPKTPVRVNNSTQKENKALVDTPPLVQQLFDHARKNEKVKDDKTPTWYCSQLLNYYQLIGVGMPRYSYFVDGKTKLIQAHIILPDKRIFVGDACANHEQAAGNVAKKVYMKLKLASILPNMKTLQPPPQHWYLNPQNANWSPNIRPPGVPCQAPEPKVLQIFPEWVPKRQHVPTGHHGSMKQQTDRHYMHHNVMHKSIHAEAKTATKNFPTFVPLQAQKKSRLNTAKEAGSKHNNPNQSAKDSPQPVVQQKTTELPAKATTTTTKVETVTSTVEKPKPLQSNSNQVQSTQTAVKPKKSRVAAKFGIKSQTEENIHSNKNST